MPQWLNEAVREVLVVHGLPILKDTLKGMLQGRVQEHEQERTRKKGDKTTFGEAMTKLRAEDQNAHDKIVDFLTTHLTRPADQEDFQINAARTGPGVQETVDFLKLVAALPDHDTRSNFLTSIGYIGGRSENIAEKLGAFVKKVEGNVEKAAKAVATRHSETDQAIAQSGLARWAKGLRKEAERKAGINPPPTTPGTPGGGTTP